MKFFRLVLYVSIILNLVAFSTISYIAQDELTGVKCAIDTLKQSINIISKDLDSNNIVSDVISSKLQTSSSHNLSSPPQKLQKTIIEIKSPPFNINNIIKPKSSLDTLICFGALINLLDSSGRLYKTYTNLNYPLRIASQINHLDSIMLNILTENKAIYLSRLERNEYDTLVQHLKDWTNAFDTTPKPNNMNLPFRLNYGGSFPNKVEDRIKFEYQEMLYKP